MIDLTIHPAVLERAVARARERNIIIPIEYWAKIGQIIEENPDLPLPFIQEILIGKEEIKSGIGTPYVFGE